ncbi:uncharacterized protein PG986_000595 [Apiospora aurea]|uniref:Uncharacterized protein n=1 Tax=Apiospora aurea TaxID=335848 RepID=A0ABR1QV35_9PEZI
MASIALHDNFNGVFPGSIKPVHEGTWTLLDCSFPNRRPHFARSLRHCTGQQENSSMGGHGQPWATPTAKFQHC